MIMARNRSALSPTDLDSVSELSDISSVISSSSTSSISSLSGISSSSESSSSSSSDSSSSSASSSLSSVDCSLQSVRMNESHNQSTSSEGESRNQSYTSGGESRNQSNASGGEATSPSDARSMSIDVARMLSEIGSINRYCEDLAATIGHEILPSTSTPTILRGRRRILDVTPVETIDLSNLDFIAPVRLPTNRTPDAVIDLCTPDRSHSARPAALIPERSSSSVAIVDLDDGPSPPKRVCPTFDQSQREDGYKCPVCLEGVRQRQPVSTKCGHVFCKDCLVAAINTVHKCPLCNKKLTQRQFSRIYL